MNRTNHPTQNAPNLLNELLIGIGKGGGKPHLAQGEITSKDLLLKNWNTFIDPIISSST